MTLPRKKEEERPQERDAGRRILGRNEIAAYLRLSNSTASRYRREFPDFPVKTDPYSGVWEAGSGDLDEWRARHIDLFTTRQERLDALDRGDGPLYPQGVRRW